MTQKNIHDLKRYLEMIDREIFPHKPGRVFFFNQRFMKKAPTYAIAQYHRQRVGMSYTFTVTTTLLPLLCLVIAFWILLSILYSFKMTGKRNLVRCRHRIPPIFQMLYGTWFPTYSISKRSRQEDRTIIELIGMAFHEVRHRIQDLNCFERNSDPDSTQHFENYRREKGPSINKRYGDSENVLAEIDASFIQEVITYLAKEAFGNNPPSDEEVHLFIKKYAKKILLTRYTLPSEKFF